MLARARGVAVLSLFPSFSGERVKDSSKTEFCSTAGGRNESLCFLVLLPLWIRR